MPVLRFLRQIPAKVRHKCTERIERLAELGHELRRPDADYLEDGIYELRVRFQSVNYRILYFFHGREVAVLACGLTKEDVIPARDLALAKSRKEKFIRNPEKHTYYAEE